MIREMSSEILDLRYFENQVQTRDADVKTLI